MERKEVRAKKNPKLLVTGWCAIPQWSRSCHVGRRRITMSFGLYLLGFLFLTGGLVYGATLMHVPSHWIAVLVLIMVGLAIVKGVRTTRPKDSA
jgi:hypothetical protein